MNTQIETELLTKDEASAIDKNADGPAYIIELKEKLITLTYEESIEVISCAEKVKNQRNQILFEPPAG